jgi:hypothetical protein
VNLVERGLEPPAQYYERPELWPHNQFYWDAFWDLGSERQIGMGVGAIPRSAIKLYADEFDITGDEYDVFYRMLRMLDNHYLSLSNSNKQPEKGSSAPADDVDGVSGVIERIQARAQTSRKKQRKEKVVN